MYLSSGTDAYQPVEATQRMTRRCLEQLAEVDWPLRLLTRSPLVTRDIDLFEGLSDIQVGLTVPTVDDELRRHVEPSAPPIEGRLKALRLLADAGLRPFAMLGRVDPDEVAGAFRDAGVAIVHLGACQYLDSVTEVTARRLPPELRDSFVSAIRDRHRVAADFAALRVAFRAAGVPCEVIGPAPQAFAKREIRWVEGASGRGPA